MIEETVDEYRIRMQKKHDDMIEEMKSKGWIKVDAEGNILII